MNEPIDRKHCASWSDSLNETNDCAVVACAVATGIDYPTMREYLKDVGAREYRDGAYSRKYHEALKDLGYKLTRLKGPKYAYRESYVEGGFRRVKGGWRYVSEHCRYTKRKVADGEDYNSATVTTLEKELTEGTYLVGTKGHVACLKDGVIEDWTKGRKHRVTSVYKVEEG